MNKRTEILETAANLINGDREAAYGAPKDNLNKIAAGWSLILGAPVTADEVALCMAWLKMARLSHSPHEDGYIDAAAYIALAAEVSDC